MILIALGSNLTGRWGTPVETLKRAVDILAEMPDTSLLRQSLIYETAGVGPGQPGVFANCVMAIECHCGPDALLRRLKMIERLAGPRSARRWGPRALDLDILDYRGRIIRWPGKGKAGNNETRKPLILPHPLLHLRPFVLVPLNDVAPDWRHPVFYLTASQLWSRKRNEIKGRVLRAV